MNSVDAGIQYVGYGLSGLSFLVLSILLLTSYRGRLRGRFLTIASLTSAVWAFVLAFATQSSGISFGLSPLQLFLIETLHDAAWLLFLSALLSGAVGTNRFWVIRFGGISLVAGILALGIGREIYSHFNLQISGAGSVLVLGSLLTALYGLVVIEQIYRNARESQRDSLKYLCLGVGGMFAYDLFLYSNAILTGHISDMFWGVRGFVVSMCVPLIAVAARRAPSWSVGIFVSRQIVFYTATLFGAGAYLTIVGFIGYFIQRLGGQWGQAAQVVFFCAAVILLFLLILSDASRARLRVFISKHFFRNKYDYREEWLRLIDTLTSVDDVPHLPKRAIKSLAQILDSASGVIWIRGREMEDFRCAGSWNIPEVEGSIDAGESVVRFIEESGWVIDLHEFSENPGRYVDLVINADIFGLEDPALVVPLLHNSELIGMIVLSKATTVTNLNYEDRDLLKTAGQQIASYLAQELTMEHLAEVRQFETFNRLTAYLMHDLKNVIAQQSLVVENARKHKNNPLFIDDAFATIKGSVARMRRIIEHLQQRSTDQAPERVEVGNLIMQAVSQCADREPVPRTEIGEERIWVRADRDRLLMALYHTVRNAQDATHADGEITISVDADGSDCKIEITDTGVGMRQSFIRDRLFRPFDSTKGAQGMGMGAYQVRETVCALGGEVRVQSELDIGTTVILEIRQSQ